MPTDWSQNELWIQENYLISVTQGFSSRRLTPFFINPPMLSYEEFLIERGRAGRFSLGRAFNFYINYQGAVFLLLPPFKFIRLLFCNSGKNDTCRCFSGEIRSVFRYVLLSPALQTKWVSEKPTLSQKIISNSVKRTIFTESTCFAVLVSLWTCDDIRCTVWVVYILTYARPRRWPAVPVNRQSHI